MNREEIYQGLTELIPESKRRASTPRVSKMFNRFLDPLVEIQHQELEEAIAYEKFDEVFGG